MPAKNSIKTYVENGYYHIYNRGVEKRIIFQDDEDYRVFLKYLKEYLSPPQNLKTPVLQGPTLQAVPRQVKNYFLEIELLAYCLMPNHIHFLIKQASKNSMKKFTQSLFTRYSMFFNKKYNRVGSLFQGKYKAVMILDDSYLLHLSRYIHLNPSEFSRNIIDTYSSYKNYLGIQKNIWVKPEFILSFFNGKPNPLFKKVNSYQEFVEKYEHDSATILEELVLE